MQYAEPVFILLTAVRFVTADQARAPSLYTVCVVGAQCAENTVASSWACEEMFGMFGLFAYHRRNLPFNLSMLRPVSPLKLPKYEERVPDGSIVREAHSIVQFVVRIVGVMPAGVIVTGRPCVAIFV